MTEASNEALDGVDMEIAAATEVDSDGMAAGEFSPAVEGVIVEENEDDPDSSTTAYSMTNLEGIEADVDEDPESLEPKLPSDAVSGTLNRPTVPTVCYENF